MEAKKCFLEPNIKVPLEIKMIMFFRNLNLNANPERWNQRCFLFIQSVINAKLSLEFFHGLFINLPSLLIMKGCTILIRKKWPRWIFCFGDKTCIMKDSFIIRRCNYSGLHCIHSSKFNIQRRLYCLRQEPSNRPMRPCSRLPATASTRRVT